MKTYLERLNLQITPLVAYGLVALFLMLGAMGLQNYNNTQNGLAAELQTRQSELSTLRAIKNTDIWPFRLEKSLVLKKNTEDKLWKGSTSGLIAAQLQQVIRNISKTHDINNVVVSVDPEPSYVEGVEILRFDYKGHIASGKHTIDFFKDIASSEKSIIITELDMTNSIRDKRPTYMTLSGLIPIILTSQTER